MKKSRRHRRRPALLLPPADDILPIRATGAAVAEMPMPHDGEDHDDFMERCMGDDTMMEEFPNQQQRRAVCERQSKAKASAVAAPSRIAAASAPVEITAAEGEGKRPRFSIVGYTGAAMNVAGFFSPVILDLAGFRAERQEIPVLRGHDDDRIVGQTDAITIGSDVRLSGTFTSDGADAADIIAHSKNGFRWRASVGADIIRREFVEAGKTVTVNGRELTGPLVVAREALLREISFVAIGADNMTSADVAAARSLGTPNNGSTIMPFDQWVAAKGFDPAALNDAMRAALQAGYDAEINAARPPAPPAPTPTPTPPQAPASTETLDQIFARQRAEDKRVAEITRITAEAIADRPGMIDELERMSRAAIEAKTSPAEYELIILRATRARPGVPTGGFGIRGGDTKTTSRVIEAALCISGGLDDIEKHYDERTLNLAADRFRTGLRLCEAMLIVAREHGYTGHSVASDLEGVLLATCRKRDVQAQGWSTISLPNILSNVANKFLRAGFDSVENTWRAISDRRSVPDFKAISTYSLTGGLTFEEVGPGGELKHGTLGETTYSNQAKTYGKMLAITRRDIINDDLDALSGVPRRLGRGGALGLNRDFWTAFMDNATFFTSARGNYFEGAATNLQLSSLTTGETLFMNQTDPDGDPVAITPRILLVPNALAVTAANLMNSTQIANNTASDTLTLATNPHAGKFTVVQSSYLSNAAYTGNSTTAWYLLASPGDLPVIEVAFLNGRETPIVESADADFNSLGIQFRGYFDYGIALQEYRAGVKSKGAA